MSSDYVFSGRFVIQFHFKCDIHSFLLHFFCCCPFSSFTFFHICHSFPFCFLVFVLLLQVGYGNAFSFGIFLTSFLGVLMFRRWASDATLILIGLISYALGIYWMSFVTATWMFYLGEAGPHFMTDRKVEAHGSVSLCSSFHSPNTANIEAAACPCFVDFLRLIQHM